MSARESELSVKQRIFNRLFGDGEAESEVPERVGRFRIDRKLGSGGMGTVWEGWDEELQRRVALKFLRPLVRGPAGEKRLAREAQGLAQLSHPNVVPVYDVGRHEDLVWIAMEYVPGQTLGEWARAADRSPSEILRHWLAAGRGLAAIHAAGLIHRDIKPNNVLLGDDGRVRIVDFGLVKLADGVEGSRTDMTTTGGRSTISESDLGESLTGHDSFVGTPAYAAPEHWRGHWADFRSDQYAYCVALWEALCGSRPSRSKRLRGGLVEIPPGVRLSKRLHRALSRGLALEPRDRFPDMASLLAALEPPTRRWLAPGVAALVTAAIAGVVGLTFGGDVVVETPTIDPCAESSTPVDAVWTDARARSLQLQLPATTAEQARELLDEWSSSWAESARQSCEDVHVRHLQSEQALDRRSLCLTRQLDGLEAFMRAVEAGQVSTAQGLIEWFSTLGEPRECLAEAVLLSTYAAPPLEHVEEIAALDRQLTSIGIGGGVGGLQERIEAGRKVRERAEEIGWKPLIGEAALVLGRLEIKTREVEAARSDLGAALDIGVATNDVELMANSWSAINRLERLVFHDSQQARWTWERQSALFEEVEPSQRRRARLRFDRGQTLVLASELDAAEEALRSALKFYDELGPVVAWEYAAALRVLGNLLSTRERADEALALFEQARSLELRFGVPSNADRAYLDSSTLLDEGLALFSAGKLEQAHTKLAEGLEIAERDEGPRSEKVARIHLALAATHEQLGNLDSFRAHAEAADEISLLAVGPTHPFRVDVLSALGSVALEDGRAEAAVAILGDSLSIIRDIKPRDSLEVALAEQNLAVALHEVGEDLRAEQLLDHAVVVLEDELGRDTPALYFSRRTLGEILLARGETARAHTQLEQALTLLDADSEDAHEIRELLELSSQSNEDKEITTP